MSQLNDANADNASAHFPASLDDFDLPGIVVGNAFVAQQGAQVLSWRDAAGQERLYLSPLTGGLRRGDDDGANALKAKAIRGGSPISFPQFSGRGALPKHGFIRNMRWQPASSSEQDAVNAVDAANVADANANANANAANTFALVCTDNAATRRLWPHAFSARMEVQVSAHRLRMTLTVINTGNTPCEFTVALHTYLRVGDVRNVRLHGLQGMPYQDAAAGNASMVQADADLTVTQELDRVYLSPPRQLTLHEPGMAPLLIEQQGFADSVVWNPGPVNAAALADFPDDGWLHMLCVEAASVDAPVRLAPGQRWTGSQTLSLA